MKYIDSNVFIYPIIADEKVEKKAKFSRLVLLKIAEGRLEALTSVLTWDEVVWVVRKFLGKEASIDIGEKFLRFPHLKFLPVTLDITLKAQKFIEIYDIKPRDAIHAACALKNNVNEIISYDKDLDKVEEIKRVSPKDLFKRVI